MSGFDQQQILERIANTLDRLLELQTKDKSASPYLNLPQTAEYIGRTPSAVYNLIKRGQLKPMSTKKPYRFKREELDKWIHRN